MPTFQDTYLVSSFGYSGRISFSSTGVAYFFPLIDTALISIDNSVGGSGNPIYNTPADVKFPLLFQITATAACRIRQRIVHPSVTDLQTASIFTRMVSGGGGYTNVAAGTDTIRNATLPSADVAAGTASTSTRIFNVIRSGSYGGFVPAGLMFPVTVNNLRDCWVQVIARDGSGSGTTGEIHFQCVSDTGIVGY